MCCDVKEHDMNRQTSAVTESKWQKPLLTLLLDFPLLHVRYNILHDVQDPDKADVSDISVMLSYFVETVETDRCDYLPIICEFVVCNHVLTCSPKKHM